MTTSIPRALQAPTPRKTYFLRTFGCWTNDRDAETLAGLLEAAGFTRADSPADAGIILINTCCVCENADAQARSALRAAPMSAFVCVTGCLTQQPGMAERLRAEFLNIRCVAGTGRPQELYSLLAAALEGQPPAPVPPPGVPEEGLPVRRQSRYSAYVAVSTGCDSRCAYCVVPLVRGREQSRASADILREIAGLVSAGYKEVTLVGQNVDMYGRKEGVSFARLLRLASETGIERIRFYTSHPRYVSRELLETMSELPAVEKHLHLPLQSGSDAVLRAMRRGYTAAQYAAIADDFYRLMPRGSLTTDIIAGFPGETDADFQQTLSLYRKTGFDFAYCFAYSAREGTAAASLPEQLSESLKRERWSRANALIASVAAERARRFAGGVERVLVSSVTDGVARGRSSAGLSVCFGASGAAPGDFADVWITATDGGELLGHRL